MRYARQAAFVLLCAVAFTGSAYAQPRFYAGGGIIADNDQTNSSLTDDVVASWSLVAGVDLIPHMGLRVLVEAPRARTESFEGTYLRPPARFPHHETLTRSRRTITFAIMADVHGSLIERVRFAITYGLAQVTHDSETVVVRQELRPEGPQPVSDLRQAFDHDWVGLSFGGEVPIAIVGRVEVVPEVRIIFFPVSDSPHPYITRAGVGMRWRF